jgi:beta-xylosidase
MSPDGTHMLGDGQTVFEDPKRHPTMEGPKFYKRDGWYYILAPAGGVPTGWQVALRSKRVFGPYEDKIVLEQGDTPINGPHQGALVDTPSGEWWFLHFQESLPYGRIVHLQPVQWSSDGWPMMGIDRHPVLTHAKPKVATTQPIAVPQTSDEFDDTAKLGLQWQWHANHKNEWCALKARPGWLRLFAQPVEQGDLSKASNLLLQKLPAKSFAVETFLQLGAQPEGSSNARRGLVMMGKKHAALSVERSNLVLRVNNEVSASKPLSSDSVRLKMSMRPGGLCTFTYATAGREFEKIGDDFQAVEGVWVGAKVGLFCIHPETEKVESHADFDYFRFSAN